MKPLYGHQEEAVVGYNPKKPGRPSHCYHTYSMAGTRLVFDVDVVAGNEHTSKHSEAKFAVNMPRAVPRAIWVKRLIQRGLTSFGGVTIGAGTDLTNNRDLVF